MAQIPPNSMMPTGRFSGTLNRLATGSYQVQRRTVPSIIAGRLVPNPNPQNFFIFASIQHTTPHDLLRLPEGQRTTETITIWTNTVLQEPDPISGAEGDVVYFKSRTYQVQRILDWSDSGGYNKVLAQKMGI